MSDSKEVKVEFNQSFTVTARLSRMQDQLINCFVNKNLHLAYDLLEQITSAIWIKLKVSEKEELTIMFKEAKDKLLRTNYDEKRMITYISNSKFFFELYNLLVSLDRKVKELQHKYGFYMMEEDDPRKAVTKR
jgi:uncharacterized protein involved in tolerance to divalent cations